MDHNRKNTDGDRVIINDTSGYHIDEIDTLGWELTLCNSLEPADSPIRPILERNGTFGALLFDFLSTHIPMEKIQSILEVGGGYGYIMRDFLEKLPGARPSMMDISPFLLSKQKQTLSGRDVAFYGQDFLTASPELLQTHDLVILNENIGDFPTACGLTNAMLDEKAGDGAAEEIRRLIGKYGLVVPSGSAFNFNLGAVRAVELLCSSGVRYVYLSEHSCEAAAPEKWKRVLDIVPSDNPERIALRGHDEYTIRFSNLEAVAAHYGYHTVRGNYTDILPVKFDDRINFILMSKTEKDEHEIIRLFIGDLYKYEYLVLLRDGL
jgi:hypothetical protein